MESCCNLQLTALSTATDRQRALYVLHALFRVALTHGLVATEIGWTAPNKAHKTLVNNMQQLVQRKPI